MLLKCTNKDFAMTKAVFRGKWSLKGASFV